MMRKPFLSFFFALAALLPASSHAQFGVYGTATLDHLSGLQASPLRNTAVTYNDSINPIGGTLGVYYDFRNVGPVRLGADLRGVIARDTRGAQANAIGPGSHVASGLAGVRASFHTPIQVLAPYIQASAGIGRTNYGILSNDTLVSGALLTQPGVVLRSNFEYHLFAGLDLHLGPVLDFRVVELGYGGLDPFGTYSHNYPMETISTGVVFHFPASQ